MAGFWLGCSGWDYDEWIGPVYESRKGSKLAAYSRVFRTAEINSTFYRAPSSGMVLGWAKYTPDEFVFAAKVPQTVTHDRLLKVEGGAGKEVKDFCELMRPLLEAGKLGVLLLQLPPRLRFHEERTRSFFETLPQGYEFAIEFRNESWMRPEAFDLLREYGVAYTVVDEPLLPPVVHVTSPIAYFRWHGHGQDPWYNYRYSKEELEPWVPKLKEVAGEAKSVFGYFNNHFHGYAPENCLQVLEMLGALDSEQRRAIARIRDYRRGIVRAAHGRVRTTTLEDFGGAPRERDITPVLRKLSTRPRIDRARRVVVEGVQIDSTTPIIQSRVGNYAVVIDADSRRIGHNCEDWRKNIPDGPLCKHVAAVFIALPADMSLSVLTDLRDRRETWRLEYLEEEGRSGLQAFEE